MPQSYQPGQEGQVDWYEAWAELAGAPTLLQVFTLRSMASGAAFHRAYERATQQAFLEAHEHAFNYFQGVLSLLRYDNLKAVVKKILRGLAQALSMSMMTRLTCALPDLVIAPRLMLLPLECSREATPA